MYLVGTAFKYDFLPLYIFLIKFKFVSTNYWCKHTSKHTEETYWHVRQIMGFREYSLDL